MANRDSEDITIESTLGEIPLSSLSSPPLKEEANKDGCKVYTRSFAGGIVRVWDLQPKFYLKVNKRDWWSRKSWEARIQPELFLNPGIWKAGLIEFVGTFLLIWMVIVMSCGIMVHAQDYSYFPTAIAIVNIPLIALTIYATATTSGGHLNPTISLATWLAGLTEFPRFVVYVCLQILASIAASYTAKHMLPEPVLKATMLSMCSIGTQQTPSQALTLEIFCDMWLLFVAFGIALDERQRQVFPPWLAPIFIGTAVSILIYTTSTISQFGNGAIGYPIRCFGPAVAMGLVTADHFTLGDDVAVRNAQWIYWVGPIISSCVIGVMYRLVPPGYMAILQEKQQLFQANSALVPSSSTEGPATVK